MKYATRVAEYGKSWSFVVQYNFIAVSISVGDAEISIRTPSSLADSITDLSNLTPTPSGVASRSGSAQSGRRSVTSIRESSVSTENSELSRVISKIQFEHRCLHCSLGHCYVVMQGLPHLQLNHGCVTRWAKNIMQGQATIEKLPESFPEFREWKKQNNIGKRTAPAPISTSTTPFPPFAFQWPFIPQGVTGAAGYGHEYVDPDRTEIQSSPPPSGASQFELLLQWMEFAVERHKECSNVDLYEVLNKCKDESMGMQAIREILSKKEQSSWREVSDFGMTRGLARAMHLTLADWQAYRKAHSDED